MRIGIVANVLQDKLFDETLAYFKKSGTQTVEPGYDGYAGGAHVNPEMLLVDEAELVQFCRQLEDPGLIISALSCHESPIHPDAETATQYDSDMRNAALLCEQLGLDTITCFSDCAGDHPGAKCPNWVTCSWPSDYLKAPEYQWNDVLTPYREDFATFAKAHGITKIVLELHPGFVVHNSGALKRLRGVVDLKIGINFDPNHLIWQEMDSAAVLRELKESIFHVHVKNLKIDPINRSVNGILDTKRYSDKLNRSRLFRTLGYENDAVYWKTLFFTLRMIGYDGAVSIEHEDSLVNRFEGLEKAVSMMKECVIVEGETAMWWV